MKNTLWIIFLFFLSACVHQRGDEIVPVCSPGSPVGFENSVKPILAARCSYSGCHDGSDERIPTLISFEEVHDNAPDIAFQLGRGAMPPVGWAMLTGREKAVILCWIDQGAAVP